MSTNLPYANKDLGQHFLKDQRVVEIITDHKKDYAKAIIEVGPGPAILTEKLSKHGLPFKVVEKDTRFFDYIHKWVSEENIHFADALKMDFSLLFQNQDIWLVSNLPYNISVPLFMKFLRTPSIKWMTLMFQKEVGDKIFTATPKKNQMNSLMALARTYFKCEVLAKVPPGAFVPPPKVDSVVLGFERIESPVIDLSNIDSFEKFLRNIFQFKRKQVGKVLKSSYDIEKITEALTANNLKRTDRAEIFSLEQIHQIYKILV